MISVLFLGFLIGLQHALEADHVAAVTSLATRARSAKAIARLGAVWGLGHSITLLFFGGLVLLADWAVPEEMAQGLELAVGVMLILLGAGVLRRLYRERVHFHLHRHGGGVVHMHAHSHAGERRGHDPNRHEHEHPRALPLRSLLVGMMHGAAGSAALLLLALSSVRSVSLGIAYILLFGLGSIVGMAALSAVIAVPLGYSARALTWAQRALQAAVGVATVLIGGFIVYDAGIGYVTGA
jgi:ABC-type nickel/cobalt efflux system permease component RcnA